MSVQVFIILGYFILTVTVGVLSSRKSKRSAASFSGAQMGVFAIVCASAGEWLGGTATTGVSEYGFAYGLSGAWYTIANGIGVMFLALCFAKLYRSLNSVTVPGIIENFFGVKARTVSSVLLTVVMLAVGLSQMIAAGKLGQALLGLDFNVTVTVFAAVFIVYTLTGGMKSVAATNVIHLFVMYIGVITALILAIRQMGGWDSFTSGISAVEAQTGGNYFSMTSIGMPKVSSWIIASLLGACTAQAGVQPVLAAKDIPTARKACVLAALVVAPFGLITAMIGMTARVMSYNGTLLNTSGQVVTDGKLALSTLMMNLPPLEGGLVLAAELAAILSTVSPIILASGTMLTKDLYQRLWKPDATDAQVLHMSRVTTALSGVVCAVSAMLLVNASRVLDIVYSAYSLRGALFIVVLLGIFWKKASEPGACVGMLFTGVVVVVWVLVKSVTGSYPISANFSETYAAVITAFAATVLFSLLFPDRKDGTPSGSKLSAT